MKITDNRLTRTVKEYWVLTIPFVTTFALLRVSPMMYDGWAGPFYYQEFGGLISWIEYVLGPFRQWVNGRIASNFICGILESFTSEIPLDIVGALVLTGILLCLFRLFDLRHKLAVSCLYTALLVFMPYSLRTYVVQIALLQYLTPVLFFLLMLLLLKRYENSGSCQAVALLYPLSVIACTWMENTSVAYGVILAVGCIRRMQRCKKIDWKLVGAVAVALSSGLFMVTAPGMTSSRITISGAQTFLSFAPQRLYEHIKSIFLAFIYQGCLATMAMAMVLAIVSGLSAASFRGKRGVLSRAILCVANGGVFLFSLLLGFYTREFQYTAELQKGWYYLMVSSIKWGYTVIVCIVVLLYILWLPINVLVLCKMDWELTALSLYGILLIAMILPTNQIGSRIYSPMYLVSSASACVVLARAVPDEEEKGHCLTVYRAALICVCVLALDFQAQLCNRIKSIQDERMRCIELIRDAQFLGEDKEQWYCLPVFNERDICQGGSTDIGTFHYPQFLERYGLNPDTKILFTNDVSMFLAVESVDSSGIQVRVENDRTGDWLYDYTVSYKRYSYEDYSPIVYEPRLSENSYYVEACNGEGYYQISVAVTNANTGEWTLLDQTVSHYLY